MNLKFGSFFLGYFLNCFFIVLKDLKRIWFSDLRKVFLSWLLFLG